MSDTEQEEGHRQPANKPRPISFGAVFSKTPTLIAGTVSPRRSVSSRISNYLDRDNREQPSRDSSTSPLPHLRPATSQGLSVRSTSPLHLSYHMDPESQDDKHNNINKHFSKFSFVKSYANSATDASDAQEELQDEYSEDGQEISRFGSVSTSSEYPPGTSKKVKSPPPGNKVKSGPAGEEIDSNRGYPFPSGGTTSSLQGFLDDINIEDGIMLAGESERGSKFSLPIGKKMSRSGEAGSVRNDSASHDRMVFEVPPIQVQAPITPTVSHVTQEPKSPRAEKTLHVPFLHKFKPRSKGSKRPSISGPIAVQHNEPHGQQTVASFFDAASSDGEDDDDRPEPEPISKDSFERSVLVSHNDSPQVGLTDILNRGPSIRSEDISPLNPLGTQRKLHSSATKTVDDATRENRRSGVVGWPVSEHDVDGPQTAGVDTVGTKYARGDDRVSGLWDDETNGPPGSAPPLGAKYPPNGLRSNPTPVRGPPPKRVVTFPTNMTERPDSVWDREPSTPHPFGRKANLTVVVYPRSGSRHRMPALEKVLIPLVAHEGYSPRTPVNISSEKRASSTRRSFDDEALFLLLRASYRRLRGTFIAKCSARRVCGVRLLAFENQGQLVTDGATHQCFPSNMNDKSNHSSSSGSKSDEEAGFAEARLLELYRCPKLGRSRWEWWDWVRGLQENIAVENGAGGGEAALVAAGAGRSTERFALELVEGWSVTRIVMALVLIGACSIAACLLWILLGVNNHADAAAVAAGNPPSGLAAAAASTATGGTKASSSSSRRDGVAITSASSGLISPTSLAAEILSASARLPGTTAAPALGSEVSDTNVMNDEASSPAVEQRDGNNLTSMMSSMASQTVKREQTPSPTSNSAASSDVPVGTRSGGPGSRVGAGVAMGVLVLLVGWMLVGAWLAMSWLL